MKFLKAIIALVAIFFLVVWGIAAYLGPDALRGCKDLKPSGDKGCEKADAIVAVSGGDTTARADEAIKLYRNGWADLIIFSGAAADKTGPSNALVMKQRAIDAGIDPNAVITEEASETTVQNAAATISIFKQNGVKSAILVTSAYHERRAMIEFDRRALGVDLRPHPVATDKQWSSMWWTTSIGWSLAVPELFRSLVLSTGGVDR